MTERRDFLKSSIMLGLCGSRLFNPLAHALAQEKQSSSKEPVDPASWLARATAAANRDSAEAAAKLDVPPNRTVEGPLVFGRFVERIYFLNQPISWSPTPGSKAQTGYPSVVVPKGFVTDLASIPRVFYSLLPPDGPYTFPAIVHDYLYWNQAGTRHDADNIINFGMQDLKIDAPTRTAIYEAVHIFGQSAWDQNAKTKARGEKRILTRLPVDPTTSWEDWKKQPRNFI